jgi:hypothetical protein
LKRAASVADLANAPLAKRNALPWHWSYDVIAELLGDVSPLLTILLIVVLATISLLRFAINTPVEGR